MWGYDPGNVSSPSYDDHMMIIIWSYDDHHVSSYYHKAQKTNIFITELSPVYCCLVFKPIVFQVTIDRHPVRFFVHKRPHVDFFLSVVWILYNMYHQHILISAGPPLQLLITRCLSGLSWLCSQRVWKSMELLSPTSSTATRACSTGGNYYLCPYQCKLYLNLKLCRCPSPSNCVIYT